MQTELSLEERMEIANRCACTMISSRVEGVNVWSKNGLVRIYLKKGYLIVNEDGVINASNLEGMRFSKSIANVLHNAGFNVGDE